MASTIRPWPSVVPSVPGREGRQRYPLRASFVARRPAAAAGRADASRFGARRAARGRHAPGRRRRCVAVTSGISAVGGYTTSSRSSAPFSATSRRRTRVAVRHPGASGRAGPRVGVDRRFRDHGTHRDERRLSVTGASAANRHASRRTVGFSIRKPDRDPLPAARNSTLQRGTSLPCTWVLGRTGSRARARGQALQLGQCRARACAPAQQPRNSANHRAAAGAEHAAARRFARSLTSAPPS